MKRIIPAALAVSVVALATQVFAGDLSRPARPFAASASACPFVRVHAAPASASVCPFVRMHVAPVAGSACPYLRGRGRPASPPAWRSPGLRILTASAPADAPAVAMR